MTHSSEPQSIPQTQDELRERFVSNNFKKLLDSDEFLCDVKDPHPLGILDPDGKWGETIIVKRENYRYKSSGKRKALLYWSKDGKGELMVATLEDDGKKYNWNGIKATKDWSSYSV